MSGQIAQAGFFGVQMVAPRSIIACAKSPARLTGVFTAVRSRIEARAWGRGVPISYSRETTRSTLPSTTTADCPNAIAATAAAV